MGQLVLLRRLPAAVLVTGGDTWISRKLKSKARPEQVGEATYVLGDVATGQEVVAFKQPVHVDRLVVVETGNLLKVVDEQKSVWIEGFPGSNTKISLGWPCAGLFGQY